MSGRPRALFMTGATGLIGSRVLRRLLDADPGLHAYVLVRKSADAPLDRSTVDAARARAPGPHAGRGAALADSAGPAAGRVTPLAAAAGPPAGRSTPLAADGPPTGRVTPRAAAAGPLAGRVTPLVGDVTRAGLGLDAGTRRMLADRVGLVVHAAADTVFSRPLPAARRVNTRGTANVLELSEAWPAVERFVHVSTAFVAGRRTGTIPERDDTQRNGRPDRGFVNAYERSKAEAERLVRSSAKPWVVLRPSTVVCDDTLGRVSQLNAVHRALRLYHAGLASMLPGTEESSVDLVTADYVADCVRALATAPGVEGRSFHLCAGRGAIGLGRMLDDAHRVWAESAGWRRRGIARPAITDLDTYRLFERTVEQTGDARLRRITRSLSHFVPQLALPKRFETTATEQVTGIVCPPVVAYWERVLRYLLESGWGAAARAVGSTA